MSKISLDRLDEVLASLSSDEQQKLLDGAAAPGPSGVEVNLDDPRNLNTMTQAVGGICLVFATVAILLRCYSRIFIQRKFLLEDYLGVCGYILTVGFCAIGLRLTVTAGMFVHLWEMRVKDLPIVYYAVNTASSVYAAGMMCLKSAILTEWIRTFSPHGTRGLFWWACQALLWINIVFYCTALIVGNLTCKPYERIWDKSIPGTCMDRRNLDISNASLNLVSHLLILVLPQMVIWKLNMVKTAKIGISVVFAIGLLACISAAFRLNATIRYLLSDDTTFYVCGMALWCLAELTLVLLVLCVPTIPKVFRDSVFFSRVKDSLFSWSFRLTKGSRTDKTSDSTTAAHQSQTYQKIHESIIPLKDVGSRSSTINQGSQVSETEIHTRAPHDQAILRTIHIERRDEPQGEQWKLDEQNYKTPWVRYAR